MINIKILFKAMSFMFLPTLAVLTLLLVGFFDPIAMWTFIKSDSGGAVIIRIILFLAEVSLVWYFYYKYLQEDMILEAQKDVEEFLKGRPFKTMKAYSDLGCIKSHWKSSDSCEIYNTPDKNIVIIKLISKIDY
jgi:hypothetical protein